MSWSIQTYRKYWSKWIQSFQLIQMSSTSSTMKKKLIPVVLIMVIQNQFRIKSGRGWALQIEIQNKVLTLWFKQSYSLITYIEKIDCSLLRRLLFCWKIAKCVWVWTEHGGHRLLYNIIFLPHLPFRWDGEKNSNWF